MDCYTLARSCNLLHNASQLKVHAVNYGIFVITCLEIPVVTTVRLCFLFDRFEPDMLAFSGCYYGGGDKERYELGEIRKRWITLPVRFLSLTSFHLCFIYSSQWND